MEKHKHDDYKIGIICALPKERTAVEEMLDTEHAPLEAIEGDYNTYSFGAIGPHNVVVASLAKNNYGNVSASGVANDIRRSFPSIKYGFMVGIAGGMPRPKEEDGDIRLGDVVVGLAQGTMSVINYRFGKVTEEGFEIRSQLAEPPEPIGRAVSALETQHQRKGPTYLRHLSTLLKKSRRNDPRLKDDYYNKPDEADQLFEIDGDNGTTELIVERVRRLLRQPPDEITASDPLPKFINKLDDGLYEYPHIHYGSVASADQLVKTRRERDVEYNRIREQTNAKVLCFEMEASGIVRGWPRLVVRGICDYCDSHKNDLWQNFAAATAAAYTKDLLYLIAPTAVNAAKPANEIIRVSETVINIFNIGEFHLVDPQSDREKVLRWLLAPELVNVQTTRLNKLRQNWTRNNTGQWILSDLFPSWLSTSQRKSLWLRGAVGEGKSVICSMIIDKIQQHLFQREAPHSGQLDLVLFTLFSFDDPSSQTLEFVLRFLLFQLAAYKKIPDAVLAMHSNNLLGPSEEDFHSTFYSVLEQMQIQCSRDTSVSQSGSTRDPYPRSLTVVIDALDELSSIEVQDQVLQLVKDLQGFAEKNPHFPLRIALCTRQHRDIEDMCTRSPEWSIIDMSVENIKADIRTFASSRIQNHPTMKRMSSEKRMKIGEIIADASKNMFRLASLYMDELSKWAMDDVSKYDLEGLLSRLPKKLDRFYDYILDRIAHEEMRNDMFVILKWVLVAARPLTVKEVVQACATTPGETEEFSSHKFDRITNNGFKDRLVGLVVVHPSWHQEPAPLGASYVEDTATPVETQIVSLAHFSVKEYLLRMEPRGWSTSDIRCNLGLSQLYAAQCCLTYLLHCSRQHLGRTREWSFRAYAWQYWATHLAASPEDALEGCEEPSTTQIAPKETHTNALALKLFNLASFPALGYRGSPSSVPSISFYLRSGRVDSESAFKHQYSKILQDPEFPFDFSEEDLGMSLQKPIYQTNGLPDPYFKLRGNRRIKMDDNNPDFRTPGIRPGFAFPPLGSYPQSIRLVILHPSASRNGTILCSQLTETLDNDPRYAALSYRFDYSGDPDETILINGRERAIRPNLAAALRELRLEDRSRVLWIDALCVNMSDPAEWGSQVRIMDRIYKEAEEVIVWLGPESGNSEEILEDIEFYASSESLGWEPGLKIRTLLKICIPEIFDQPIWKRLWILVEVVLASRVTIAWGHRRLDWEVLIRFTDTIAGHYRKRKHSDEDASSRQSLETSGTHAAATDVQIPDEEVTGTATSSFSRFQTYRQLRRNRKYGRYPSFPEILFKTRHFEVSNPRDKIVTVIHLLSPAERGKLLPTVDYNLSYLDLNVSVAKHCLNKLGNLDILSINNPRVRYRENDDTSWPVPLHLYQGQLFDDGGLVQLPSWVPAWHCTHWSVPLMAGKFLPSQRLSYRAGGPLSKDSFELHDWTLSIRGIVIGGIRYVLRLLSERTISHTLESDPALSEAFCVRYGNESFYEVVRRTCSAGLGAVEYRNAFEVTHIERQGVLDDKPSIEMFQTDSSTSLKLEQAAGFWEVGERYHGERVLCLTSEGHLALVPSWSREGDEIQVFLGAPMPYVTRVTSEGSHRLVGDCYVHGIMHGELFHADGTSTCNTRQVDLV